MSKMSAFVVVVVAAAILIVGIDGYVTNRYHLKKNIKLCSTSASTDVVTTSGVSITDDVPAEGTMFKSPAFKFFDFLLSIPILHDVLFGVYRKQTVEKAEKLGLKWTEFMNDQWSSLSTLKSYASELNNVNTKIPDYFYATIHAYKDGNLCWESALEEDLWSKLMIAPLYNNALDGDVQMRSKWLSITKRAIDKTDLKPKYATDLGCGTGLSMYMLESRFPSLESMTGVDLSTYKLAVCENKRRNEVPNGDKYKLFHAPAESSPVASNSQDIACLCLVAHESPEWVTQSIFKEAHRILKPGGYFTMLDLDKENLEVLLRNPFVAAIYKRTEPYMGEYIKLNTKKELEKLGFEISEVDSASRSHKVYVAKKL